jgi:tetratricopeptide (TPR) repeat protein
MLTSPDDRLTFLNAGDAPELKGQQFLPMVLLRYNNLCRRAIQLMVAARYESALNCINHAIGLRADRTAAWHLRTTALIYLERYPEALQSADRAILLGFNDPEIWVMRAVALNRLGHYQACYASYERALGREYQPWTQAIKQQLTRQKRRFIAAVRFWKAENRHPSKSPA